MEGETALTGMLPFVFFVGAVMAFPLSLFLLKRYKAAVLKTMTASGGAAPVAGGVPEGKTPAGSTGVLETVIGPQRAPRTYRYEVRHAFPGEVVQARVERIRRGTITARAPLGKFASMTIR